ncbi:MAG: PQQ-like beta-propeller repeat protein [Acidobacteria bacterium]|nr:PQQ-like beta-propeller repeat protein [Acidobacteriota bacterium]
MRRLAAVVIVCFACAVVWTVVAIAQGRGATDWMTSNGDAQRSSWIRTDTKISKDTIQKPGFKFLWKLKLNNEPKQLNSLMPPSLLELLIGYRGFRALAFVGGSSDNIFAIDTDLGRMEWQKRFPSSAPAQVGSLACPGGMTAHVTRPTIAFMPSLTAGGGGGFGGRRSPARSAVGQPDQGAVTLAQVAAAPPPPPPSSPARPATPPPAPAGSNIFGRGPFLVYALSSDGMLHTMHLSNGDDYEPPVKFLTPNANAHGLIIIDNIAYVVTEGGCGGAPNGMWALDLASKQVTTWKANISGSAGPAFGPDGTIYVGTRAGEELPFSLVALEPKTLKVKGWYTAGKQEFTSSPVIFEYKGKTLIAAATKDGRVHLLDSAGMSQGSGGDNQKPLHTTPASAKAADFVPGSLSSWQDAGGTRWILAATVGSQASEAGFKVTNGAVTNGAVVAWKVVEEKGVPTLQPGWASRDLVSPLPPTIINGVVFATSSGEFRSSDSKVTAAQRAQRSTRAVLYALDATTGKELWKSGPAITSFVRGGALSGGGGQVYVGTYDGTLYAFGFTMEH